MSWKNRTDNLDSVLSLQNDSEAEATEVKQSPCQKSPDGGEKKEKKIQRVTLCMVSLLMNLHFFLNLIVTQAVFLLSVQYAGIGWIQL